MANSLWSYAYLRCLARRGAADFHPGGRAATATLVARLGAAPGQRVLEVGCGTGRTATSLAARGVRVCALDLLPEMLAVARRRSRATGARVAWVRANATVGLPFGASAFDRVYTESALGIFGAWEARTFLDEVMRVLKPGGRYVANEAVWRIDVATAAAVALASRSVREFGLPPASPEGWTLGPWRSLMESVGFVVQAEPLEAGLRGAAAPLRPSLRGRLVSLALALGGRVSSRFDPAASRERRHFARLEAGWGGAPVEAWLFTLEKPGPSLHALDHPDREVCDWPGRRSS